jgi:hypothetical protein
MPERNDQGTGKHPHKSTEEPYPHHEGKSQEGERGQKASTGSGKGETEHSRGQQQSGSSDLKEREYRDAQGNVHHHTNTYEEEHGNEK